jgi:hypothetical protein
MNKFRLLSKLDRASNIYRMLFSLSHFNLLAKAQKNEFVNIFLNNLSQSIVKKFAESVGNAYREQKIPNIPNISDEDYALDDTDDEDFENWLMEQHE